MLPKKQPGFRTCFHDASCFVQQISPLPGLGGHVRGLPRPKSTAFSPNPSKAPSPTPTTPTHPDPPRPTQPRTPALDAPGAWRHAGSGAGRGQLGPWRLEVATGSGRAGLCQANPQFFGQMVVISNSRIRQVPSQSSMFSGRW